MAELYISRLNGSGDEKIVRIDARSGTQLLGRVEVSLENFAAAVMGQGAVPAWFSNQRDQPGHPVSREADIIRKD